MKKQFLPLLALTSLFFAWQYADAQILEDFESSNGGDVSFTSSGITFTFQSSSGETFNVFEDGYYDNLGTDDCLGCGWNGTGADQKFVDNTNWQNGVGNGTSLTINSGGSPFTAQSFYIFCSTASLSPHTDDITITGSFGGQVQYQFTKSSGFSDIVNLTPNNGFTFIDLATEDAMDHSQTVIDEITITGTGDLDYLALDGFTWNTATFSVNNAYSESLRVYPIPSKTIIFVEGLTSFESFEILDLLGKKVMTGKLSEEGSIDISQLKEGIYLLQMESGVVRRFIKD